MGQILAFPRTVASRSAHAAPSRLADRVRALAVSACAISLIAAGHALPF